ncbi:MAG: dihydrodipicolinate synthase family protein [Burkholderiales bacterium]|jgi:4-hydroxy-tetrahydrodipicolinate synthase|nr:dihydrodipicolinate synthase family protein [Burkholderiales bacterium]
MEWKGVISAITTPFKPDYSVDHAFLADHAAWQIDSGVNGIVALGSLGEAATLSFDEKVAILKTLARVMKGKPLVAGIASLSTAEAVSLAKEAQNAGCAGVMVLPPYVYSTDWREMKAHVSAVIGATTLTCMLYNNPPAYKTDFLAPHIAELAAEHPNLQAVKESSGDARRVTAVKALCGDRLAVFAGLDDMVLEALRAGAVGWIAGLVNALPRETMFLFREKSDSVYRWFLPLLRMDVVPKFVQLIKLVQQEVGKGHERVRGPRLVLAGAEREEALKTIHAALASRPRVA